MVPPLTVHGVERDPGACRGLDSPFTVGVGLSRQKRHPHGILVCVLIGDDDEFLTTWS